MYIFVRNQELNIDTSELHQMSRSNKENWFVQYAIKKFDILEAILTVGRCSIKYMFDGGSVGLGRFDWKLVEQRNSAKLERCKRCIRLEFINTIWSTFSGLEWNTT